MGKSKIYPLEILLVESCTKNIHLVRQMLNNTKIHYILYIANDANETYAFLQKEGNHKNAPKPDAILHSTDPASDFEEQVNSFLDTQILFLKFKDDKIEILKSNPPGTADGNKQITYHIAYDQGIKHILEAISSVKNFLNSLKEVKDEEIYKQSKT